MNRFEIIVCLLPVVFMIHDFEEIIFVKRWIGKNSAFLAARFPFLAKRLLPRFEKLSTEAFALAVFEEFVLLCAITFTAIYFQFYYIWLGAFMAFSIHLLMHIVQWVVVKKYIPAIVTSFLALPYSIYGFLYIWENNIFTVSQFIIWTLVGLLITGVNLLLAHRLGEKLDSMK